MYVGFTTYRILLISYVRTCSLFFCCVLAGAGGTTRRWQQQERCCCQGRGPHQGRPAQAGTTDGPPGHAPDQRTEQQHCHGPLWRRGRRPIRLLGSGLLQLLGHAPQQGGKGGPGHTLQQGGKGGPGHTPQQGGKGGLLWSVLSGAAGWGGGGGAAMVRFVQGSW